jgi:hypothetical protein
MARKAKSLPARYQVRFVERISALPDRTRGQIKALRAERDESMRRARNASFYIGHAETDLGRQRWVDSVRERVREARELNHNMLRVR